MLATIPNRSTRVQSRENDRRSGAIEQHEREDAAVTPSRPAALVVPVDRDSAARPSTHNSHLPDQGIPTPGQLLSYTEMRPIRVDFVPNGTYRLDHLLSRRYFRTKRRAMQAKATKKPAETPRALGKLIGYARVSTTDQDLMVQREALRSRPV